MGKSATSVDIVIVNWNSGELLRRCLHSLLRLDVDDVHIQRVVVVDNASVDRSADSVDEHSLPITLIRNDANVGFAAACNKGAMESRADYLLFLNPDVELFRDSLRVPCVFLAQKENMDVGICGIQLLDATGQITRNSARFPKLRHFVFHALGLSRVAPKWFHGYLMHDWDHCKTQEVDQVIGAFFLVRRALFHELCGFDQRFFVYFEEVDFSLRARRAGWRSVYLANARAYHLGGGCSGTDPAFRLFHSLRSRMLYAFKHFDPLRRLALAFLTCLVEPISRFGLAALSGSTSDMRDIVIAYARLWRALPAIFSLSRYSAKESTRVA